MATWPLEPAGANTAKADENEMPAMSFPEAVTETTPACEAGDFAHYHVLPNEVRNAGIDRISETRCAAR